MPSLRPDNREFALLESTLNKIKSQNNLRDRESAFYYLILDLFFNLQPDEIEDSITDSKHQEASGKSSGHDRGIDAVYIDSSHSPPEIHMFNFKSVATFKNTHKNFPSAEIDKILGFLSDLFGQDDNLLRNVNSALQLKIREIWKILEHYNPKFYFHICTNHYYSFEEKERKRFERILLSKTHSFSNQASPRNLLTRNCHSRELC